MQFYRGLVYPTGQLDTAITPADSVVRMRCAYRPRPRRSDPWQRHLALRLILTLLVRVRRLAGLVTLEK